MEVAVVGLAGAGIALWASGIEQRVPPAAARHGVDFVRAMAAAGDPESVGRLVAEIAKEILAEVHPSRHGADVVHRHLTVLPRLIADHGLGSATLQPSLVVAINVRLRGGNSDVVAHHIVSDLLLSARQNGDLTAEGLDETLCFFLLVRLLNATLDRCEHLLALRPALAAALDQPSFRGEQGRGALRQAYASLASETRDETLLQNAVSRLESALVSGSGALTPRERAVIEHVRGTALRSLGEARANLRLLEDALRAKLTALEHYEAVGDPAAVARLREDFNDLNAAISHLVCAARVAKGTDRRLGERSS